MPGHVALILHAHLPFVRHPEHEHFLEEDWFFEAITESYIPLLRMMQRLVSDGVPFKLTMSLTPTLCAMLQDQLLRERYVQHVDLVLDLAKRERKRNRSEPKLRALAGFYLDLFSESRRFFVDECKCDLLSAFRELRKTGALEIIASAATHGLLPLLQQQSREAARSQVLIGRDVYVDLFGAEPTGGLSRRPCLSGILSRRRLRSSNGTSGTCRARHQKILRPEISPHHRMPCGERVIRSSRCGKSRGDSGRPFYRTAATTNPRNYHRGI